MPKRAATRKPSRLRVVSDDPSSVQVGGPPRDGVDVGDGEVAELVAALAGTLMEGVAQARSPLHAELVLCGVFGTMETGLPVDADEDERAAALTFLLGQVIGYAETLATVPALALLRVCSVVGPASSRAAASAAAGRLVTTGVPDRPWAGRVGSPAVLRAWRYGDVFGAQSSFGVLFDYQGREHALMVLVDHLLGDGIKDCWVTEGRAARGLRDTVAAGMAGNPDVFFEDIDAATATGLLGSALANPPCPEQDDQIEDVAMYLYLVQSRAEHLARLAGLTPVQAAEPAGRPEPGVPVGGPPGRPRPDRDRPGHPTAGPDPAAPTGRAGRRRR